MRPVLFLDVDGVLNGMSLDFDEAPVGCGLLERKSREMLPHLVARLTRVLVETGCDVVVSSTWRKRFKPAEIAEMLTMRGMPAYLTDRFVGQTDEEPVPYDWPNRSGRQRGLQIQRWIDTHRPGAIFAIVDDDAMGLLTDTHLVQTDTLVGISDDDVERLVELLGRAL